MSIRDKIAERTFFWIVLGVSLSVSLGWFLVCVGLDKPHEAHRGGNVGLAMALILSFIKRDYGIKLFESWARDWPALLKRLEETDSTSADTLAEAPRAQAPAVTVPASEADRRLNLLARTIQLEAEGRNTETAFIAVAMLVGTVFAGFGDWFASFLLERV